MKRTKKNLKNGRRKRGKNERKKEKGRKERNVVAWTVGVQRFGFCFGFVSVDDVDGGQERRGASLTAAPSTRSGRHCHGVGRRSGFRHPADAADAAAAAAAVARQSARNVAAAAILMTNNDKFYLVLLGFTWFYLVLLGFTGFY